MYRTAFNSQQCCEVFKNKVHCVVCVCVCVRQAEHARLNSEAARIF